jgi:hypothetical protein
MPTDPEVIADRLLIKLADCKGKRDKYDAFLFEITDKLRDLGVSWVTIAEPLGVTHQAARTRYGKVKP